MMLDRLCCASCLATLQLEDGYDLCPSCLRVDHLREALSEDACLNCTVMPCAEKLAQLAKLEQPTDWSVTAKSPLPPGQAACPKQPGVESGVSLWENGQVV
ncbi:hypothetical protein AMECASPLE_030733 [Ameca splendens]|uniref:Uncharacterized protein n=1 Tax=Ameca splendens TaxID=208324 RepID=A0ABV0ZFK4_9TELE